MFWRRRKESAAPNYQPFHTAPNVTQIDRFIALTLASGLVSFSELQKACADFDTSRLDVEAVDDLCRLLVGTRV
jgi:hypothetical protein